MYVILPWLKHISITGNKILHGAKPGSTISINIMLSKFQSKVCVNFPCLVLTEVCEEYEELCDYLNTNFEISCYGECGENSPFGESSLTMENAWAECGSSVTLTYRYYTRI